ncbi:MAG: PEP-CTERM sorting domain-containing protein [Planctomycetota bacterium]
MMKRVLTFLVVFVFALSLNSAWADDYNPPPWAGEERVTRQVWEFGTDLNPSPPDIDENPMGIADLTVTGDLAKWMSLDPDHPIEQGVWKFEDQIVITIPNFEEPYPLKKIWVELTYWADSRPLIHADDPDGFKSWGIVNDEESTAGYLHATWEVLMPGNPPYEIVYIEPRNCTTFLDEVVIYTICTVPEPATFCLLGLGAVALLRRRRA